MTNEELIENTSEKIVENLVSEILSQAVVEVRFEFLDADQWAVVSVYNYEEDNETSLRLLKDNCYELHYGYYNDDDEFFEIVKTLSPEEKNIIPKGIHKVMAKVLSDEQGMRLPGKLLSK
jgi:hypothetical protein